MTDQDDALSFGIPFFLRQRVRNHCREDVRFFRRAWIAWATRTGSQSLSHRPLIPVLWPAGETRPPRPR